ncbi:hypothetical protein RND81_08G063700 [Saponaria officinalis]|uniref:Endonuclease/exonuclease/phosphatase domain-containing protein n=1 Tax=Saponaria officinalis TaxID=3572 RepID=A0AAW1J6C6_SAPOF
MKLCSWNVRGCNDPLMLQVVADFIRQCHFDILGILETRIKEKNKNKVVTAKFKSYQVLSNCNSHNNGRIWILWNPATVTVSSLETQAQFVHCTVLHHATGVLFSATFVYAFNDALARESLWSALRTISSTVREWVVLGDFNVVHDVAEKVSNSSHNLNDILAFNACILHCALDDLQSSGCEYTWSNKQDGNARVWCKLDRVLVNAYWLDQFSSSSATFLPAGISDHSPAVIDVFLEKRRKARFIFLNCWVSDPSYQTRVQEAWGSQVQGTPMFRLFSKLRNVRFSLQSMHRASYSGIQGRLQLAKDELEACQMRSH